MKTNIKKVLLLLWISLICFPHNSYAVMHNYNIAWFRSSSFNNDLPLSTGNKANVIIQNSETFSGAVIISDSSYNIADFTSSSFNNWMPINTWKSAKVVVDVTLSSWTGDILKNDISYNIASFQSDSFNNWLPINTWKSAKVVVDINNTLTNSWSFIYWDTSYNFASFSSNSFNNWMPINTWKSAKVVISLLKWDKWDLTIEKDSNYNIASFQSDSFNNWLPINTWKSAKVEFLTEELENIDPSINDFSNDLIQDWVFSSSWSHRTSSGNIYINSKQFVFTHKYEQKNRLFSNETHNYNLLWPNWISIMWDNWLIQLLITKNPATYKNIEYWDSLLFRDWEIESAETILNLKFVNDTNEWMILTYPYDTWSGRIISTNYPIIKGLYIPNKRFTIAINNKDYVLNTDEKWHFETSLWKLENGSYSIKGISWETINFIVDSNIPFEQPYITSIYNDDYIYADIFHMQWFANEWEVNYSLKWIDWTVLKTWNIKVGIDRKFSFILGDKSLQLTPGRYVIEVWQYWKFEKKAFTLVGDTNKKIGVLNIKNNVTLPTTRPTFIWYSKENRLNNDTILVSVCDITDATNIKSCEDSKKRVIWTTNTDVHWFFQFTPLQDLENWKFYEFQFKNTSDMSLISRIVIKTDTSWNQLYWSQITSLFNWLNLDSKTIDISGFTKPNTDISINWIQYWKSKWNGSFSMRIDYSDEIRINYWWIFEQIYTISKSKNNINNIEYNYFQNFQNTSENLVERR